MNEHDVEQEGDNRVVCACGRTFVGVSLGAAKESHRRHFNIAKCRRALEEGKLKREVTE